MPVTAVRKSGPESAYRLASVLAVTVAVRGVSLRSAISPKPSPRPSWCKSRRSADSDLAVGHHVEQVAGLALGDHDLAGGKRWGSITRATPSSSAAATGGRAPSTQQPDLDDRHGRAGVGAEDRGQQREHDEWHDRADADDRESVSPDSDQGRDQHRAERKAEHVDGSRALRRSGRAPSASRCAAAGCGPTTSNRLRPMLRGDEQRDRHPDPRPHCDQGDRRAHQGRRPDQRRRQPAAADQSEGDKHREKASRAEGGVQDAHARLAHPELAEREHHEQHIHRPEKQRLRREHADQHRRAGLAGEHLEALDARRRSASSIARIDGGEALRQRQRDPSATSIPTANTAITPARTSNGDHHRGDQRPDHDSRTLDPAESGVARGQLVGAVTPRRARARSRSGG